MKRSAHRQTGFTLLEVIVVVAVIIILAVLIVAFGSK